MPKAISPRRDGLALLERDFSKDRDMDPDMRSLFGWTCRETRRLTPGVPAVVRLTQALAVRSLAKALTGDPSLATLTRVMAELLKGMKLLGIPLPDGHDQARRMPRRQPGSSSGSPLGEFFPERVRSRAPRRGADEQEPLGEDDELPEPNTTEEEPGNGTTFS